MQTVGSFGRLLRIKSYPTAGTSTWTKNPDVGFIIVELVGGGGGGAYTSLNGTAGGTTSFGAYFSAAGGGRGLSAGSGGAGGVGTGGDINFTGGRGWDYFSGNLALGGENIYGGRGAIGSTQSIDGTGAGGNGAGNTGAGGAGGYSKKLILASSLTDTVTITVGAGGAGGYTIGWNKGGSGRVIIYEFSA